MREATSLLLATQEILIALITEIRHGSNSSPCCHILFLHSTTLPPPSLHYSIPPLLHPSTLHPSLFYPSTPSTLHFPIPPLHHPPLHPPLPPPSTSLSLHSTTLHSTLHSLHPPLPYPSTPPPFTPHQKRSGKGRQDLLSFLITRRLLTPTIKSVYL